jgi:alpha-aminoadipic semialdehyde synthase
MTIRIGIRREDKNQWERRVPLSPSQVEELLGSNDLEVCVQPSEIRIFPNDSYSDAGAALTEDLSSCKVVFSIKEIPADLFQRSGTYVFFSHTIKGQDYNMPMLARLMELGCNLIDYERIVDEMNRRLIVFGKEAGWAGMIDSLWALGRRLDWKGVENPYSAIKQAIKYKDLEEAKEEIRKVGRTIREQGLPSHLCPVVVGFAGYGNVSQGAQEVLDCLPVESVTPQDLLSLDMDHEKWARAVVKVVFKEEHIVRPISEDVTFELQDYYDHPEKYGPAFERLAPHLTVLVNCIYWNKMYPRLITKGYLKKSFQSDTQLKLEVIGDISCDIGGAIECTVKCSDTGDPLFVYDPLTGEAQDGVQGRGVVVLAVDNLPAELPAESSTNFGAVLLDLIPCIVHADYAKDFDDLDLPPEVKRALIVHNGELTPDYRYLHKFLNRHD